MNHTDCNSRLHVWIWVVSGLVTAVLVAVVLSGCFFGSAAVPTPTPTRTSLPVATSIPTIPPQPTLTPIGASAPTLQPTATLTPLPENVNPLTGEVMDDASKLDRIAVAIKIDNYPPSEVWPQTGLNSADIIFEHYNEGWFSSRFTAIFLGKDPEKVGSVRSGRIIDLELPAMYKAAFACSGFSNGVLALVKDSDLYPDWVVSESLPETLSPTPFYRDNSRIAPFNMYTSPARVRDWAAAHGISGRQDIQGMTFSEEPPPGGSPATYIQIPWNELNAEWHYDEASGRYKRWSDSAPHMDALDGQQLNAANVVVLYVAQWDTDIVEDPHWGSLSIRWALWNKDNPYRPAILFRNGQRYDGMWQRPDRPDVLTITDTSGHPIPFNVGNTFFEVLPAGEEHGIDIVVQ
ncbi:MAG: DUF3048 domain-containing protein [Anaerolineae bacterium]|jgi:hypothetical protein